MTNIPLTNARRPARGFALVLLGVVLVGLTGCVGQRAKTSVTWSQLPALPDPLGVAGAFAGVSNDALLVGGGANFPDRMPWAGGKKVWHDEVYVLTQPNGHWITAGKLPRPLAYGVSLTTAAGVLCLGGSDASRHYDEVFLLQLSAGKLVVKPLPSLPVPLANAVGALVESKVIIIGGSEIPGEQAASSHCFVLDLRATDPQWEGLPPCPGPARILPVAAACQNIFYLFGGAALASHDGKISRVYLRDAWSYAPSRGWMRLADLPRPCVAGPTPAPAADARIFLAGGDDGTHVGFQPPEQHPGFAKSMLVYDVKADAWQQLDQLPAARATAPAVAWHNGFVIPSGEVRPGVRSPEVWNFQVTARP